MKRTTKRTSKTTPEPVATTAPEPEPIAEPITPAPTLDAMIEQRRAEAMSAAMMEGGIVLTGYWNWFNEQIRDAERQARRDITAGAETFYHLDAQAAAWTRARHLFFTAAPIALANLRELVAEQIRAEYNGTSPLAAADVAANLKDVSHGRLLHEADYDPVDYE